MINNPHKMPELGQLVKSLSNITCVEEIYLFGSRARGDNTARSDIDIAILCPSASDTEWDLVLQAIEAIPSLIKIDCIRFDQLKNTNPLKQAVLRDMVVLYRKGKCIMAPEIQESFNRVEKAIKALKVMVIKPPEADRSHIDATIQRFEFTIELFWKLLKKLLLAKGVIAQYPRDVLQESYAGSMIHDQQIWLNMLNDRNQTSHTYNEDLANKIYANIKTYMPIFETTFAELVEKFKG